MNKRRFLYSLGGSLTAVAAAADIPPADMSFDAWRKRAGEALQGLQRDPDKFTDAQIGNLQARQESRNPEIALPAIFTAALRGQLLQLKWWTAGNTEADVRVAIIALYELCAPDSEPHLEYFADNAARFADEERVPRLAEAALVKEHRASFAAAFHAAILKNTSKNARVAEFRESFQRKSRPQ